MMPREEIEELLVNEGDFLVRKTEVKGKLLASIAVHSLRGFRKVEDFSGSALPWLTEAFLIRVRERRMVSLVLCIPSSSSSSSSSFRSLKSVKKKSLAELVEHLVENKTALHGDGCAIVRHRCLSCL